MPDDSVTYSVIGGIALLLIDSPPVNAMSVKVRAGLLKGMQRAEADPTVSAIVIAAKGATFVAGADLAEFDQGFGDPSYRTCFAAIEDCCKPVVTSVHGTTLGAGVELALACHYRTAQPKARLGFPEITLGVVPGAGATQRLPRVVGARCALQLLISGAPISADEALSAGLIDEINDLEPAEAGLAFARKLVADGAKPRRSRDRAGNLDLDTRTQAETLQTHERALKGRSTQYTMIEALRAAGLSDFEVGLDREKTLSDASLASRESQALRHMFFAERRSSVVPGLAGEIRAREISKVAVVGAGTMGSGIAMAFSNVGYSVTLVDAAPEGLERGRSIIRSTYASEVKRGRITLEQAQDAASVIKGTLNISEIHDVDLVVEAVFENMDIKKKVLINIDQAVSPQAIIATNTSSLSVSELGAVTRRPEQVIGLHFFSPAHVMKLLEIVRSDATSAQTLSSGIGVGKRIKKIPVVSGDGFGFIGNRMMLDGAFREAEQMMLEGALVDQIDQAVEAFGFAMGPSRVNDMAGVDIGTLVREQLALRAARPDPYCIISDTLTPMGRIGQKVGKGFYSYAENPRVGAVDPEVTSIIETLAAERQIARRVIQDEEIVERFVLQLINVGANILAEGVAYRAADIDVVWVHGYGFPRYRGGPMFYADTLGLRYVLDRIKHWHDRLGHYWTPSPLLVELANGNGSFTEYDRQRAGNKE